MKISALLTLLLLAVVSTGAAFADTGAQATAPAGVDSLNTMSQQFLKLNPEVKFLGKPAWGGADQTDAQGNPIKGHVDPSKMTGAGPYGTLYPPTAASACGWDTLSKTDEAMYMSLIGGMGGFNGQNNSDLKAFAQQVQAGNMMAKTTQYPMNAANAAKAQQMGAGLASSNAMGEVAKGQAASAIDYSSKFLQNFTTDETNKWNQVRNGLFVPMAILLLLPGAVLSQVKAIVAAGNPVIDPNGINPWEGIFRSIVAIFLIPGTWLIINYGIDVSNSVTFTIASEYTRIFGTSMYKDAVCAEIKAFPVKSPQENANEDANSTSWTQTAVNSQADFEKNFFENKTVDPCSGTNNPDPQKSDEGMPSSAMAARFLSFSGNAGMTSTWNVLCAFQMAYLFYLFFVGPVVAALWVWPIQQFRQALPNWIEGVCTLCFWSLFWNTTILLMACFKGVDETGTILMTALNFLATASVKYAFDFAGLVKAAGAEATKKASEGGGAGGGAGGGSGGASKGKGAGGQKGAQHGQHAQHADPTHTQHINPSTGTRSTSPIVASALHGPGGPSGPKDPKGPQGSKDPGGDKECKAGDGLLALAKKDTSTQTVSPTGVGLPPAFGANKAAGNKADQVAKHMAHLHPSETPKKGHKENAVTGDLSAAMPMLMANHGHAGEANKPSDGAVAINTTRGPMLYDAKQHSLFYQGADGKLAKADLKDGNHFALADGTRVGMHANPDGQGYTLAMANHGHLDNYKIAADQNGAMHVNHTDGQNKLIDSALIAQQGGNTTYASYDAAGALMQTESLNGNALSSMFYDQGNYVGGSQTTYSDTGNSVSSYYDASNQLVATADFYRTANGGYVESVSDANGKPVSIQQEIPYGNGQYALKDTTFGDNGTVSAMSLSMFDAAGGLVSSTPINDISNLNNNTLLGDLNNVNVAPCAPEMLNQLSVDASLVSNLSGDLLNATNISSTPDFNYLSASNSTSEFSSLNASNLTSEFSNLNASNLTSDFSNLNASNITSVDGSPIVDTWSGTLLTPNGAESVSNLNFGDTSNVVNLGDGGVFSRGEAPNSGFSDLSTVVNNGGFGDNLSVGGGVFENNGGFTVADNLTAGGNVFERGEAPNVGFNDFSNVVNNGGFTVADNLTANSSSFVNDTLSNNSSFEFARNEAPTFVNDGFSNNNSNLTLGGDNQISNSNFEFARNEAPNFVSDNSYSNAINNSDSSLTSGDILGGGNFISPADITNGGSLFSHAMGGDASVVHCGDEFSAVHHNPENNFLSRTDVADAVAPNQMIDAPNFITSSWSHPTTAGEGMVGEVRNAAPADSGSVHYTSESPATPTIQGVLEAFAPAMAANALRKPETLAKPAVYGAPKQVNVVRVPAQPPKPQVGQLMSKLKKTPGAGEVTQVLARKSDSLEKQMLESSVHVNSLGAVLEKAGSKSVAAQNAQEALSGAHMCYQIVSKHIEEGKVAEAEGMARDVLQNLQLCDGSEMQLKPILQSYIELLTRKGLTELATAFAVKAATLDAGKDDGKNIWG